MSKTCYIYSRMEQFVYLDYNSTTPVDEWVLEKMLPWFCQDFGNASSSNHAKGWQAAAAVDLAREQVADFIHAEKEEIIFTSGATESVNLAIKGLYELFAGKKAHIITCVTEHKAVLDTCDWLKKKGAEITYLPVDANGNIDTSSLQAHIRADTLLVALMYVNNETGVIHPVKKIGEICRERGVYFFCDATQAAGKISIDVAADKIDLLCISSHKLYGPKGVGMLYLKRKHPRVQVHALLHGGGHERGLRSGSLNVPGIVGLGAACTLAAEQQITEAGKLALLRNKLENYFVQHYQAVINGVNASRVAHVTNICFKQIPAVRLLSALSSKLAISSGSACTSALPQASHVLCAMGLNETDAKNSLRFSLGRFTTLQDIDFAIETTVESLKEMVNNI